MGDTRRPRSAARWLARGAMALLAIVLLAGALTLAGALALSRGWQRERLVAVLEAGLVDALGAPVRIEALTGPLHPALALRGVRVGPAERPLAEIERLSLRWSAAELLSGGLLVVDLLEIDGLALRLRADAEGRFALPELPEGSDDDAWQPAVHVRVARVVRSQLLLASEAWSANAAPAQAGEEPAHLRASLEGEAQDMRFAPDAPLALSSARLDLVFEPASLAGVRVAEGVLHASLDEQRRLDFELRANGSFGRASARGTGDLDELLASAETKLDLAFEELDLGALTGDAERTTRLAGEGSVHLGAADAEGRRELQIDLALAPSRVSRIELSRGRLRGVLRDEAAGWSWRVDELELHGTGVAVSGRGAGTADALETAELSARIERLERLSAWLAPSSGEAAVKGEAAPDAGLRLAGSVDVRASLAGPVGQPDGRIDVDARGLVLGELDVGNAWLRARIAGGRRATIGRFELSGGRVALTAEPGAVLRLRDPEEAGSEEAPVLVEGLRVRSQGALLALDGALGAAGARALRVRIEDLALARIVSEIPAAAENDALRVAGGQLEATLRIDGAFEAPRVEGWIGLAEGAVTVSALGETFAPIDGRVQVSHDALAIETLTIGPPGEAARIHGRVALVGLRPGELDLRLALEEFALTRVPLPNTLEAAVTGNGSGNASERRNGNRAAPAAIETGGRIDADLHLTGTFDAPQLTGDLEWTHPRWESIELDRISAHVEGGVGAVGGLVRFDYAGREILTARFDLPVPERVREPVDWLHDERARIEVRGEALEFALLAPFLTRLVRDPRGTADVSLAIRGGFPEPLVSGSVRVVDGSIRAPLLRQTFAPVSGVAHFDGRRVRLEELAIGPPEAGLRAHGVLELEDLRPAQIDLDFTLTAFPLSRSSLFETNVDGRLWLAGPVEGPALTGNLALQRTRITIRSTQDPVYKEVRIRTAQTGSAALEERPATGPTLLDRASVDVALEVPGDTWIRSPEMELDVKGWGRIEKRSLEPVRLSGALEAIRGTVRVVAKKFQVRSGRAELDGDTELDPVLDVEATHPVANVLIVAHVTGRVSDPTLKLTSEPEMDEQEVVSYLFFGRPSNQVGGAQQGGVDLAAAGLAAGMALDELREIFGHSFPVDTIDLRLQEGDEPSKLEVGKYITKDVFVRIGQSFGTEQAQEVGVSYRITDHWRVESNTSSNATAGADVFWTIDY
jgi:autotransporter translocation and assembly factor TamB